MSLQDLDAGLGDADGAIVRRTVLPGGVRVLTESMPGQRSATIGAWVGVGSRDERVGHHGSTHFLEHLLFKGTARRTAFQIAEAFDAVGGEANAVTGKEHTCYFARVLDADLPMAVEVIGDMITSATIAASDVDAERGVILEELAMNDDDPGDVVHERFAEQVLGAHPLARPIGGTPASIREVSRDAIIEHYRRHYVPPGLVITAAGGVDHDQLCDLVVRALRHDGWPVAPGVDPLPARITGRGSADVEPVGAQSGSIATIRRPTEQAHLLIGGLGITATDPRRYVQSVLNTVLGGGMSSRLFQEVREKRGLAYSVYSFSSAYSDSGYFGLYAGCAPTRAPEVIELLVQEWERLAEKPMDEDELRRSIGQLCGGLVLGMEDSGSRMSRLGKAELVYGEFVTIEDALARVRAVSADDVRALAAELASRPRSLTTVGPFERDPVTALP